MLIKLFSVSPKEDYRKVLEGRRTLAIIAAVVGIVTMVSPILLILLLPGLDDHAMGYYSGSGAAILAIGIFAFCGTCRTLRDEKRLRSEQIKETDEREQEIARRAASVTIVVSLLGLYVALLVAVLVNRTVYLTLLGVLVVFILISLGNHLYYRKKL